MFRWMFVLFVCRLVCFRNFSFVIKNWSHIATHLVVLLTYLNKHLSVVLCLATSSVRIIQTPPGITSVGSRLLLSCSYTAGAQSADGVKVTWFRGHLKVEENSNWLKIESVRREDEGRYTCVVNAAGHLLTADVIVRVQCTYHCISFHCTNIHYHHSNYRQESHAIGGEPHDAALPLLFHLNFGDVPVGPSPTLVQGRAEP